MLAKVCATLTLLSCFSPVITFARHLDREHGQLPRTGPGGGDPQQPFPLPPDNDGIHLAVGPDCGKLSGSTADINAGINSGTIKTIVSFGVSSNIVQWYSTSEDASHSAGQLH
jgi:hypothetical protein